MTIMRAVFPLTILALCGCSGSDSTSDGEGGEGSSGKTPTGMNSSGGNGNDGTGGSDGPGEMRTEPGDSWSPLGDTLTPAPDAIDGERPDLVIDSQDRPIVAWNQTSGGEAHNYVARWNGTSWDLLGSFIEANSGADLDAQNPTLALDGDTPLLAWLETYEGAVGSRPAVYAAQWSGSDWELLGGQVPNSQEGNGVSMLAVDGAPLVAWTDSTGNVKVHVASFESDDWQEKPLSYAGLTAMAQSGDQYFLATGKADQMVVLVNEGSGWEELAAVPKHRGESKFATAPSLAVDEDGHPIIAWQEVVDFQDSVVVSRWTGEEWVELPKVSSDTSDELVGQFDPDIETRNGRVVLAWGEKVKGSDGIVSSAHVRQLSDDSWLPIAIELDAQLPLNNTGGPALALDSSSSAVVAYETAVDDSSAISVVRER